MPAAAHLFEKVISKSNSQKQFLRTISFLPPQYLGALAVVKRMKNKFLPSSPLIAAKRPDEGGERNEA
ncbi:hypothetical protein ACTXT7_012626 [Hymenolepis weldensis]